MNESDKRDGTLGHPRQKVDPSQPTGSAPENEDKKKSLDPAAAPEIDDARFSAGVVRLYEAVLKEPIPDEMLRLIDQIGKQEPK